MKALVIGVGRVASTFDQVKEKDWVNTHLGAYKKDARVSDIAICDIDNDALQKTRDFWQIDSTFANMKDALSTFKPDIVSICTRPDANLTILEEVATHKSVKGIWMEKPFSDTYDNGLKQIQIFEGIDLPFLTSYQRRFDGFYAHIKEHMQDLVGDLQKCVCYFSGGIVNAASHLINLLIYYFGPPTQANVLNTAADEKGDYHGDFYLRFEDIAAHCFEINMQTSFLSGGYSIFEVQILGEAGRIDLRSLPFNEYDYVYYRKAGTVFKGVEILKGSALDLKFKRDFMERELAILIERIEKKQVGDFEQSMDTLKVLKDLEVIT
jgi:predicted dehydrogenase